MSDDGDRVLFKWTPNQIAAMSKEEAERVIEFHQLNPPTMDYIVEYMRSMEEIELANARIAQIDDEISNLGIVNLAIEITRR